MPIANGFLNVDLSGAAGVYLTLSRNETDFTTFNLADPSFDVLAFDSFASLGQNGTSFAFVAWPEIMPPEEREISDGTGVCGIALSGSVITPRHPNGYTPRGITLNRLGVDSGQAVATPPFDVTPEYNTLTAKATPDVPAEQDIFYSLDGAVEGGTVTIVSHAVIQFTPPIACIPTTLSFVPTVTLPEGKNRVILRMSYEVNGNLLHYPQDYDGNTTVEYGDLVMSRSSMDYFGATSGVSKNTAEFIAHYLFQGSGSLHGIVAVKKFTVTGVLFSPATWLTAGQTLSISGQNRASFESAIDDPEYYEINPATVKLTFKVIDDLPSDAVDFTLEQWGQDTTINGCISMYGTPE